MDKQTKVEETGSVYDTELKSKKKKKGQSLAWQSEIKENKEKQRKQEKTRKREKIRENKEEKKPEIQGKTRKKET